MVGHKAQRRRGQGLRQQGPSKGWE
jgi:hypothetical protein